MVKSDMKTIFMGIHLILLRSNQYLHGTHVSITIMNSIRIYLY